MNKNIKMFKQFNGNPVGINLNHIMCITLSQQAEDAVVINLKDGRNYTVISPEDAKILIKFMED